MVQAAGGLIFNNETYWSSASWLLYSWFWTGEKSPLSPRPGATAEPPL
jgi:hypothetical protein